MLKGLVNLETDPGSRHVEALDIVGGLNVAEVEMKGGMGMTPVSLEQILAWNPEVILSWNETQGGYYSKISTDPKWESIAAIKNEKVYAVPSGPFNWFDRPPSVNRIIGLKWLGNLLYPETYQYDMAVEAKEFHKNSTIMILLRKNCLLLKCRWLLISQASNQLTFCTSSPDYLG